MGIKFYKKRSPGTKVALSNGEGIAFTTLDNVIGYFATTAETVQQEFERFMVEGRYDITEIDAAEFTRDYVEKKKAGQTSRAPWRDELTRSQVMPSVSTLKERLDEAQSVVAVVEEKPPVAHSVPITAVEGKDMAGKLSPTMKTPKSQFRPNVSRRKMTPDAANPPTT